MGPPALVDYCQDYDDYVILRRSGLGLELVGTGELEVDAVGVCPVRAVSGRSLKPGSKLMDSRWGEVAEG